MEEALKREWLVIVAVLLLLAASALPGLAAARKTLAEKAAPPPQPSVFGLYAVVPVGLGDASFIVPYSSRGFLAAVGSKLYSVDVEGLRYTSRQLGAVPAAVVSPGYPARSLLIVYPDGSAEVVDSGTLAPLVRITSPILCQAPVSAAYNGSAAVIACAPNIYLYVSGRPRPLTVARLTPAMVVRVYPPLILSPGGYRVGSLDVVAAVSLEGNTSTVYLVWPGRGRAERIAELPGTVVGAYLVSWGGGRDLLAASSSGVLLYARLGSPMYKRVERLPFKPVGFWLAPTTSGYLAVFMDSSGRLAAYMVSASGVKLLVLTAATTSPHIYTAVSWPLLTPVLVVPTKMEVRLVEPVTGSTVSLESPVEAPAAVVVPPDASYMILAPPGSRYTIVVRSVSRIVSSGVSTLDLEARLEGMAGKEKPRVLLHASCLSGPCLGSGQAPVEAPSPLHVQLLPGLYLVEPIVEVGGFKAPAEPAEVYLAPGRETSKTVTVKLSLYHVCVESSGDPYGWGFGFKRVSGADITVYTSSWEKVGEARTGKDGCTDILLPARPGWILRVTAEGYRQAEEQLPGPGNYTIHLQPVLIPLHVEAVSRVTGKPVPGASAIILDTSTKRRAITPVPITLELPAGEYVVTVYAKGYNPVSKKVKLEKPGKTVTITARLAPSLVGLEILLQHGFAPLVSAEIHITGYTIQGFRLEKTMRIKGDHASLTIPQGIYELRIESPGFEPYSSIVELTAPRLLRISMKPLLTYLILYLLHKYWRIIAAAIIIPIAAYTAYKLYKRLKPRLAKLIEKAKKGRKKKKEVSLEELLGGAP